MGSLSISLLIMDTIKAQISIKFEMKFKIKVLISKSFVTKKFDDETRVNAGLVPLEFSMI